jgi:hypothetical protein
MRKINIFNNFDENKSRYLNYQYYSLFVDNLIPNNNKNKIILNLLKTIRVKLKINYYQK